jgi:hypothetical protein
MFHMRAASTKRKIVAQRSIKNVGMNADVAGLKARSTRTLS